MFSSQDLITSEIRRYRLLILNGIIAYPIWGFLIQRFEPNAYDPIWIRLALSTVLSVLLARSFYVSQKKKYLEYLIVAGGFTFFAHTAWVAWVSLFPFTIFCGFLLLLCSLLNVLPSYRSTLSLAVAAVGFGAAIAFINQTWMIHPAVANIAIWTAIVPSLSSNLNRISYLKDLLAVQQELGVLFQNSKEGFIIYGPKGDIKTANPAASQIFGMNRWQLFEFNPLGTQWGCFDESGKDYSLKDHPIANAISEKSEIRDLIVGVRKVDGGAAWIQVTASPILAGSDSSEPSMLVTYSDISEITKSQRVILEQRARLEANAKLTALGEMAAGVAHEINNPLAIIVGKVFNITRGLKTGKFPEPMEISLKKITATVERVKKIVKGLQTFASGGEHDPFETVDLKQLVEESVSFCQEKLDRSRIEIRLDIEANLSFECRPVQISQALVNLIHNSCDAIEPQSDRWIQVWARSAHDLLVLTVMDSGTGIPADIQQKLMQPFFTTKEVGKGTGLGLSITKGLIQSHYGRFWLDTKSNNTKFIIELPIHHQSQKQAA